MFVKGHRRTLRYLGFEAEDGRDVFVEPPQIDAEQEDAGRPGRRQRQAEVAHVAQAVQHPAGVVKGIGPVAEHRPAEFHHSGGTRGEDERMLLEDPAVLVGVERLVNRTQVERILVRPLKSEDAIHRPRFAGPLQHGFAEQEQKRRQKQER